MVASLSMENGTRFLKKSYSVALQKSIVFNPSESK